MALEEQVVKKLIEKNFHISFAESCTGGMCCGTIVNVANASKVLDVSFVTYANEARLSSSVSRLIPFFLTEWSAKRLLMKWHRVLPMLLKARSA